MVLIWYSGATRAQSLPLSGFGLGSELFVVGLRPQAKYFPYRTRHLITCKKSSGLFLHGPFMSRVPAVVGIVFKSIICNNRHILKIDGIKYSA